MPYEKPLVTEGISNDSIRQWGTVQNHENEVVSRVDSYRDEGSKEEPVPVAHYFMQSREDKSAFRQQAAGRFDSRPVQQGTAIEEGEENYGHCVVGCSEAAVPQHEPLHILVGDE